MNHPEYNNPEQQSAFEKGRNIGRTEGMLMYQKHLIEQIQAENKKLNLKLKEQKGGKA